MRQRWGAGGSENSDDKLGWESVWDSGTCEGERKAEVLGELAGDGEAHLAPGTRWTESSEEGHQLGRSGRQEHLHD